MRSRVEDKETDTEESAKHKCFRQSGASQLFQYHALVCLSYSLGILTRQLFNVSSRT